MISYFKYTEGEAFTLNDENYVGFFNVIDGIAYTGKVKSNTSEELTPKKTFITEIFLSKMEFDSVFDKNIKLTTPITEKFEFFTKTELEKTLKIINLNNLNIYKSLVFQNRDYLNFYKSTSFFYGLSSTESDTRNDDTICGKTGVIQIDPFAYDNEWKFLDNISAGSFLVKSNEDFIYYCNDNINSYSIEGNFGKPYQPLRLLQTNPIEEGSILDIIIDDIDSSIVDLGTKKITIYDFDIFKECGFLVKKDEIINSTNETIRFISLGNSIRLEITNTQFFIKDKYSNNIIYSGFLSAWGVGTVLDCEVRLIDNLIAIASIKNNKYYITYIDSEFPDKVVNQFELLYFKDQKINISFSDSDSNLIIFTFENYVQTRYISNSTYPASTTTDANYSTSILNYLPMYEWDSGNLSYDKSNIIKWNSNLLKSNKYNNLVFVTKIIGNFLYAIFHNVGRIYVTRKNISEDLKIFKIPKDLKKETFNVDCSNSSLGLYINNYLKNIITDTINLYTNSECNSKVSEDGEKINISELENLNIPIENMFLNGNEQLNTVALKRIFETILEIQRKLI
jgi:hypothetical protein